MVLGILVPCTMVWAEDITPFLPTFTPEEQAELAKGRAANPLPAKPLPPSKELEQAVADSMAAARDSMRDADLGQQMTDLICDTVKTDTAHKTAGYRFVEDRAKACVDEVTLSRDLGVKVSDTGESKVRSPDERAYLACMARACEGRVMEKLFAPGK